MGFRLRRDVNQHRERALGNITFKHQYKQFFKGLTITTSRTYNEIELVRAQIIVSGPWLLWSSILISCVANRLLGLSSVDYWMQPTRAAHYYAKPQVNHPQILPTTT